MINQPLNIFSNLQDEQISAVHSLEGRTLNTGWKVLNKAVAKPGSTGSHFSVCYDVERDGEKGFLKALNILKFLNGDQQDIATAWAEMLQTYNFEKELLSRCKNKNLSKVSRLLDAGEENFPGYLAGNVLYMILEKAEKDIRAHLNFAENVDLAWKLRSLHNIAVGLKQLHGIEISHQDLKPSNIFLYDKNVSKLGDLGRSMCKTHDGPHSKMAFSGDLGYAPPEFFYGFEMSNWEDKVYSVDYYLLGSMIIYYFTGINMTAFLFRHNNGINWQSFDNFEDVLPYLVTAFDESLITFEHNISTVPFKADLIDLVKQLCYPCPRVRGYSNVKSQGNRFDLERLVTKLNVIATKAEYLITN